MAKAMTLEEFDEARLGLKAVDMPWSRIREALAQREELLRLCKSMVVHVRLMIEPFSEEGARSLKFQSGHDQFSAVWKDLRDALARAEAP